MCVEKVVGSLRIAWVITTGVFKRGCWFIRNGLGHHELCVQKKLLVHYEWVLQRCLCHYKWMVWVISNGLGHDEWVVK